jgi:hypothetical protein
VVKRLDSWPSAATARYPWSDLLDGGIYELVAGEDFQAKPSTIIANARGQAKRHGGRVRTRTLIDGARVSVVIQYLGAAS